MTPHQSLLLAADALGSALPELVASLVVGAAVFVLLRTVVNTLHTEDLEQDTAWRYDVNRINELRRVDPIYRVFLPLIQFFARGNLILFREYLPEIFREIQAAGLPRFWTAEEYLGKLETIALLLFPAYLYAFVDTMGPAGSVMAIVLTVLTGWMLRRRLAARARLRLLQIKRRLPFLLDLLTLLMEAGSTFLQALSEAVAQFSEHAVG